LRVFDLKHVITRATDHADLDAGTTFSADYDPIIAPLHIDADLTGFIGAEPTLEIGSLR
jgi:hypothetical protein